MIFLFFFIGIVIGAGVLFFVIEHFSSNSLDPVSDESVAAVIQGLIFLVLCGIAGVLMFQLTRAA